MALIIDGFIWFLTFFKKTIDKWKITKYISNILITYLAKYKMEENNVEEKAKVVAELLKLLANEHRLLILCTLSQKSLSVSQIHEFVPNITASALSQHLNQLKRSGILSSQKQGLNVYYEVSDSRVIELLDVLHKQYCQ